MPSDTRECPVCGGRESRPFATKNGHALLQCGACDLVFVDPPLPARVLAPLYSEQGVPPSGARYPFDKVEQRRSRARVRARRLRKYFAGKDAIDIGCGGGFMVDAMRKEGARAVGVDLDPEAIAFAKRTHHPGAAFYCEKLDEFVERGLVFDFGHSSQVIEHVGDFNAFVANWARLVRRGGYFFLKTPDRRHWLTGRDPATWPDPPHYTQYFSRKNIRLLLEKHGFAVEKIFFNLKPTMEILARRR